MLLAGERVAVSVVDRPRVAEDAAEDVGEEVGEEFLLFERVGLGGPEQPGPAAEACRAPRDVARQVETGKARAQDIGAEERLGFYGHAAILTIRSDERGRVAMQVED